MTITGDNDFYFLFHFCNVLLFFFQFNTIKYKVAKCVKATKLQLSVLYSKQTNLRRTVLTTTTTTIIINNNDNKNNIDRTNH